MRCLPSLLACAMVALACSGHSADGGATIEGTATIDGLPVATQVELRLVTLLIPGVPMEVQGGSDEELLWRAPLAPGAPVSTTRSGNNGKFSFGGLSPGVYEIRARVHDGEFFTTEDALVDFLKFVIELRQIMAIPESRQFRN